MRIALVHPAGSNFVPGKIDITVAANRMAPLGILSIAAFLKKAGHTLFIHDCLGPFAPKSLNGHLKEILEFNPDIVGFSTTTSGFCDANDIALALKDIRPSILTVAGGVHVSSMGAALLKDYRAFDCLVPGEGELTMLDIANGVDFKDIKGLIWRKDNEIVTNPQRELIQDLDTLPFPEYTLLKGFPKDYKLPLFNYINSPGATLITSRGCPYQCSFCDRSVFKKGFRYNSPEYVYEHINYLYKNYGVRHINIYDDLFTTNRSRIETFCTLMIKNPIPVNFNCAVRVGYTDANLISMLKKAGCLMVSLGIESADLKLLERHKSGVKLEDVKKTVVALQKGGLRVKGLFIMGLPGESEESIKTTSDFIMSLDLDDMNMSKFTPFPGAPVWQTIYEEGSFDPDWRKLNCLNFSFVPKTISSFEKLEELYGWHVKRFYTSKNWRNRLLKRLWQNRDSIIRIIMQLPTFLKAKSYFEPVKEKK